MPLTDLLNAPLLFTGLVLFSLLLLWLAVQLRSVRQRLTEQVSLHNERLAEHEQQHQQINQLREQLEAALRERDSLRVLVKGERQRLNERDLEIQRLRRDSEQQRDEREQALREISVLNTRIEEQSKANAEAQQRFEASREALKAEFNNLANEILDAKGKQFSANSKAQLESLLHPFREQVEQFRKRSEEIHGTETQQRSRLTAELQQLKELNRQMSEEAQQLTSALKGQKKTQGNWGELVLENVLDRSGLRAGIDYRREVSFNSDSGRKRPDAIVYLPQNRHLIIDAKVSLNAYTRYINSELEGERTQALREHVAAVSARIRELAERDYAELTALNSPEMVFLFIPIESAFVEALRAEPGLFEQAIGQNVLVATPTTLLTSLNIVRQLWRFEDQNQHAAELADRAQRVYAKLNSFVGSMQGVGKGLERAQESYRKAMSQLIDGKGNLIKQASEFQELGVAVKQELPNELVERARMELPLNSEPAANE